MSQDILSKRQERHMEVTRMSWQQEYGNKGQSKVKMINKSYHIQWYQLSRTINILELFFGGILLKYLWTTSQEAYDKRYELRTMHKIEFLDIHNHPKQLLR
jgi:hypothetical protein